MFTTKPAVSKLVDYLSKLPPKEKTDLVRLIDDVRHDDFHAARDLHYKRFCSLSKMMELKDERAAMKIPLSEIHRRAYEPGYADGDKLIMLINRIVNLEEAAKRS